jgi:predicted SAM-dependent methyltransferase
MIKYLHIGCGTNILPKPFVNLDIRKSKGVDYISLAYPLKFKKNSFDMVYASHVLEHFKKKETLKVLKEWVRVLKPNGILRISVPCFENLIKIYKTNSKITNVIGPLLGGQTYKQNYHYNLFNKESLTNYMIEAGCVAVHPWDFRRTIHSDYWDFSQATTNEIPISLNLEARKKSEKKDAHLEELQLFNYTIKEFKKKLPKNIFLKILNKYLKTK